MFYLYFVLPPVIIVISLALVIFLISRKFLDIKKEIEKNRNDVNDENESGLSLSVKMRMLGALEKTAQLVKIFSLRIHNWIEGKIRFLRERRIRINQNKEKLLMRKKDDKDGNKSIEYDLELRDDFSQGNDDASGEHNRSEEEKGKVFAWRKVARIFKKKKKVIDIAEETDNKENNVLESDIVMISEEVVYPEAKKKEEVEKEELENILIERIASDPRDIEAYERLGDYYVGQKNGRDARECYRQVLKLNPRNVSVKRKLEGLAEDR